MFEKSLGNAAAVSTSVETGKRLRELAADFFAMPFPVRRLPRYVERLNAVDRDYFTRPPIITNSFPHCGGPLLLEIAEAFPEIRNFGSFISSMPTIPFRERTDLVHDRLIRRIVPGEVVGAHIFFNDNHARRIAARNGVHFFIQRDLRDVAVAEAHYLTHEKFWHRLHPFFAGLKNEGERISAAIRGFVHDRFPYNYPDIAQRFARFHGWLDRYDVLTVAYEDLHTGRLGDTVRKMAQFYSRRCRSTVDEDRLVATIRQKIEACRGKTPPHMIPGIWRQMFSDEQKKEFEQVAGVLNRRLGYEENLRPIEKHRECEPVGAKVIPMHKRNNVPRVGGSHTPQAKMRRRGR